jgi:nucleoside-diphosphate-sugar epimerase
MNILVTGATGFVGKCLTERLCADGGRVTAAVRTPTDSLPGTARTVAVGDIAQNTDWQEALAGIDVVVHLAARVHVLKDNATDSLEDFRRTNVAGTKRLAEQAAEAGVRRFIFLSSVKVNGEGADSPYSEFDPPAPLDPYSVSKQEAEEALRCIAAESTMEISIIRPPLVYGPGVGANFLRLCHLVRRGIPLPIAGINNLRSMIYVENLADIITVCIAHPNAAGKTYLVSDGEDVSSPDLIRRVSAALKRPARLLSFPASLLLLSGRLFGMSSEVGRLVGSLQVNSSKVRNELGWKPPFTMEQGLRKTAEWFKGEY